MQPVPPNPNYDFILSGQVSPRRHFGLSLPSPGGNTSRTALFSLVIVLLILVSVLIFGRGGSTNKPLIDLVARAQEINRVSALAATQQGGDSGTLDLAATVQAALSSQERQLTSYLASNGSKIDPVKQTVYQNKSIDGQLTSAAQGGNLASFYQNYLKTNLAAYQNAIQTEYKSAPAKARPMLSADYSSVRTILSSL